MYNDVVLLVKEYISLFDLIRGEIGGVVGQDWPEGKRQRHKVVLVATVSVESSLRVPQFSLPHDRISNVTACRSATRLDKLL